MKKIENILEILDNILPNKAKKTVIFCEVEQTAYEVFYYSYFADTSCKQCYELVDEGIIDSNVLDVGFERMAKYVRECEEFSADKRNVVTVVVESISENVNVKQFDKTVSLYKIKKEWKLTNLEFH